MTRATSDGYKMGDQLFYNTIHQHIELLLSDYFPIPIVKKQSTFIKNTTDFINKIEALCLPSQIILITYDVTSIYTNMHTMYAMEFDEL